MPYLHGKGAENGKKLDATAFQALARAAGGEDKVQAYCQRLQPPRPKPDSTKPKHPSQTTSSPGPLNILDRARTTPRPQDLRAADGTGARCRLTNGEARR